MNKTSVATKTIAKLGKTQRPGEKLNCAELKMFVFVGSYVDSFNFQAKDNKQPDAVRADKPIKTLDDLHRKTDRGIRKL